MAQKKRKTSSAEEKEEKTEQAAATTTIPSLNDVPSLDTSPPPSPPPPSPPPQATTTTTAAATVSEGEEEKEKDDDDSDADDAPVVDQEKEDAEEKARLIKLEKQRARRHNAKKKKRQQLLDPKAAAAAAAAAQSPESGDEGSTATTTTAPISANSFEVGDGSPKDVKAFKDFIYRQKFDGLNKGKNKTLIGECLHFAHTKGATLASIASSPICVRAFGNGSDTGIEMDIDGCVPNGNAASVDALPNREWYPPSPKVVVCHFVLLASLLHKLEPGYSPGEKMVLALMHMYVKLSNITKDMLFGYVNYISKKYSA